MRVSSSFLFHHPKVRDPFESIQKAEEETLSRLGYELHPHVLFVLINNEFRHNPPDRPLLYVLSGDNDMNREIEAMFLRQFSELIISAPSIQSASNNAVSDSDGEELRHKTSDVERHLRKTSRLIRETLKLYDSEHQILSLFDRKPWPTSGKQYYVFSALQLGHNAYKSLADPHADDTFLLSGYPESLVQAVILSFFDWVYTRSYFDLWEQAHRPYFPGDTMRSAARLLFSTVLPVAWRTIHNYENIFDTCNTISSLLYEGRSCIGSILFARPIGEHKFVIKFDKPVPLTQYRAIRKLLEVATDDLCLLSDCYDAYGLVSSPSFGRVSVPTSGDEKAELCSVRFVKQSAWALQRGATRIMMVEHGQPSLPREPLDQQSFHEAMLRIFGEVAAQSVGRIWKCILQATKKLFKNLTNSA